MSQWRFRDFETEIDFSDADFAERLENAYDKLLIDCESVLKVGKQSEIIKSNVNCFTAFFDAAFGPGTSEKMFAGKKSVELCLEASTSLNDFRGAEEKRTKTAYQKYLPNRSQRRAQTRSEK